MLIPDFVLDARSVVRITCGAFLLPHTIAKLRNIPRASQFFDKVGFRPAPYFVVFTALMELVAATSLISGLYPRIGAVIAASILVVGSWAIAKVHGFKWRWQNPGVEYMIFWAAVSIFVTFLH